MTEKGNALKAEPYRYIVVLDESIAEVAHGLQARLVLGLEHIGGHHHEGRDAAVGALLIGSLDIQGHQRDEQTHVQDPLDNDVGSCCVVIQKQYEYSQCAYHREKKRTYETSQSKAKQNQSVQSKTLRYHVGNPTDSSTNTHVIDYTPAASRTHMRHEALHGQHLRGGSDQEHGGVHEVRDEDRQTSGLEGALR